MATLVTGEETQVCAAIAMIEDRIKDEKPLVLKKRLRLTCLDIPPAFIAGTGAPGERPDVGTAVAAKIRGLCQFSGMAEEELSDWFQKREPLPA